MLILRKGKPPIVPVLLGGGAVIRVRAATQTNIEVAAAQAQRDLTGLVAGSEAGEALVGILGEDFRLDAAADKGRITTCAMRLTEIYLVLACQDGWHGIGSEDGTPIEKPNAALLALLLNDPVRRAKVMDVINGAVHMDVINGAVHIEETKPAEPPHSEVAIAPPEAS